MKSSGFLASEKQNAEQENKYGARKRVVHRGRLRGTRDNIEKVREETVVWCSPCFRFQSRSDSGMLFLYIYTFEPQIDLVPWNNIHTVHHTRYSMLLLSCTVRVTPLPREWGGTFLAFC